MNTLFHPSQSKLTEENSVHVFLQIKAENCTELVHYLITQKISFRLSSVHSSPEKQEPDAAVTPEREPQEACHPICKDTVIQKIYDKYITNGLAGMVPAQDEIAAEFNLSLTTFKTRFRAACGDTFYQVYMEKRMEHAADLLQKGFKGREVSDKLGYAHPIKFNKMFQKYFGMTPKTYQIQQSQRQK